MAGQSLSEELGKLNALRQSGVLSEEEFAEQKARLLARDKVASGKADMEGYPTQKIANAVAVLREHGLKEREIASGIHHMAWKRNIALAPWPYVAQAKGGFALLCAGMALIAAVFVYIIFGIFLGGGMQPLWFGLALFGIFFSVFWLIMPGSFQSIVQKKKLPEWEHIPG